MEARLRCITHKLRKSNEIEVVALKVDTDDMQIVMIKLLSVPFGSWSRIFTTDVNDGIRRDYENHLSLLVSIRNKILHINFYFSRSIFISVCEVI